MDGRETFEPGETQPLATSVYTRKGALNWVLACIYIVSVTTGSGFLALPKAADQSGYTGLGLLVVFLLMSVYTGRTLSKCWLYASVRFTCPEQKEHLRRRPYSAIAEIAFSNYPAVSKYARHVVSFAINLTMFGSAVVYLLLTAENVSKIQPAIPFCGYIPIVGAGSMLIVIGYRHPSDKWFWPLNCLSAGATIIASVLVCYELIKERISNTVAKHSHVDVKTFSTSIGTLCFAWGGHVAFPSFQTEMKKPEQFGRSIFLGFGVIMAMYLPITFIAFFIYGDNVSSNILQTIDDKTLTIDCIRVCLTVDMILSIAIVLNPMCMELEYVCGLRRGFSVCATILRVACMTLVIIFAMSIPHFYAIMSLVGGSSIAFLTYVAPPILYMKLCRMTPTGSDQYFGRLSLPLYKRLIHYLIALTGIGIAIMATWGSISNLGQTFGSPCFTDMRQNVT